MVSLRRLFVSLSAVGAVLASTACDEQTPTLPTVDVNTCPNFINGTVSTTANGLNRSMRVWMNPSAAASQDGMLVLYFHGTGGSPDNAVSALGQTQINNIINAGGIVVAPHHANSGIFPWILQGPFDYPFIDKIVGCAKQRVGFDSRRIHVTGFSAGGMYAAQLAYERSSYVASVVTFSGGSGGSYQDPSNKYAAMILHGGPNDNVFIDFQVQSTNYKNDLTRNGHFATICNHGLGHSQPSAAGPHVLRFFQNHPFKAPSPWANGLPGDFWSICRL